MHQSLPSRHHWPTNDTSLPPLRIIFQPLRLILPFAVRHSPFPNPILPLTIRASLSKAAVQPRTPTVPEGRSASSGSHGRSESDCWPSSRLRHSSTDQASLTRRAWVRKSFLRMRPGSRRVVENMPQICWRGDVFPASYPRVVY